MSSTADTIRASLDAWLDQRFEFAQPAEQIIDILSRAGLNMSDVESLLRSGRASYEGLPFARGRISGPFPLACDHVDHETGYLLYVPSAYDPASAWPLVVVAHGGSAARDLAFAEWAARIGMEPWCEEAEKSGLLLLAPLSDRGWGTIGNSILFSAISLMTRMCHVDPDRIYLTGHSMGGHLAFRSAMNFADRWGAVSPMSGGYDFVADRSVESLVNVPGYATWGTHEPYGIREANRKIADWMRSHESPWVHEEFEGGHEIFLESVPRVTRYFLGHPRDLYCRSVRARAGGPLRFVTADSHAQWSRAHTWRPTRPISTATFHWLRLEALPAETPPEAAVQEVSARLRDDNTIEIAARHVRRLRLHLHPRMVDLSRPITVTVNGAERFRGRVEPDLAMMLGLVREFDDRGRIFHAAVDIDVPAANA